MGTKGIIMWAVFIAVCATIYFYSRKIRKEIEEGGIETTGVISKIIDSGTPDVVSFDYYAVYTTAEGEKTEGILTNPAGDLKVGQQVRLKYHPKYKMNARLITDDQK